MSGKLSLNHNLMLKRREASSLYPQDARPDRENLGHCGRGYFRARPRRGAGRAPPKIPK